MNIIKIGNLNWPTSRWADSYKAFDRIFLIQRDDVIDHNLDWVELISFSKYGSLKNRFNGLLFLLLEKNIKNILIYNTVILIFRIFNLNILLKVKKIETKHVYSSYNDYDRSDHLTVILLPFLKNKFKVRAVKESRPDFRYPEYICLLNSNSVILNSRYNLEFFHKKYNLDLGGKDVYFDLDEDWRSKEFIENVSRLQKYSKSTNLRHFVILSGRVFSELGNIRSGARQYYIKLIEQIISLGQHVDLYTEEIIPTSFGLNLYSELEKKSNGLFKIKGLLDFKNDPLRSYSTLSKYDFGILHNFETGEKVSYFDKFNIPNRFYEYQISGVLPIVKKGESYVIEEVIRKYNCGIVYDELDELILCDIKKYEFFNPSFEDYCVALKKIYNI